MCVLTVDLKIILNLCFNMQNYTIIHLTYDIINETDAAISNWDSHGLTFKMMQALKDLTKSQGNAMVRMLHGKIASWPCNLSFLTEHFEELYIKILILDHLTWKTDSSNTSNANEVRISVFWPILWYSFIWQLSYFIP